MTGKVVENVMKEMKEKMLVKRMEKTLRPL
jgi:hypothetical protein